MINPRERKMSGDQHVPPNGLARWLRRLELRCRLDDGQRRTILNLPHEIVEVLSNRDFVRLGERTHHACLVVNGLVGRFGQSASGMRQISAIHIPGDMVDLHSVVAPTALSALSTLTPATILRVPHAAMIDVAEADPVLARAFWRDCVVDAAVLAETVLSIGRRPAAARIAHLLCELAVRFCLVNLCDGPCFEFNLTQPHLGDATGLTAVHVNRTLRQLRESRIVTVAGREVQIHDWYQLARIGDFDPIYLDLAPEILEPVLRVLERGVAVGDA